MTTFIRKMLRLQIDLLAHSSHLISVHPTSLSIPIIRHQHRAVGPFAEFNMIFLGATILLLGQAAASPMEVTARQANCPPIHVFGARETTVSPGFGSAGTVVNSIIQANPGTTSEAIVYPACGGQASCGGVQYADSARQGTAAVATAVNAFNQRCPDSQIILVGYSQGGQIMDNAYCGGGDTSAGITDTSIPISASAQQMIRAAIMMGSPRFVAGQSQNVGDCLAQGVSVLVPLLL